MLQGNTQGLSNYLEHFLSPKALHLPCTLVFVPLAIPLLPFLVSPISLPAQELIRNSGATVIFLDISLGKAAARVGFNRDRPLLLGNPRAQWNELMSSRRPIYEALATAVVPVDDRTVNEICADILAVA